MDFHCVSKAESPRERRYWSHGVYIHRGSKVLIVNITLADVYSLWIFIASILGVLSSALDDRAKSVLVDRNKFIMRDVIKIFGDHRD
jgi:hypothetical protein